MVTTSRSTIIPLPMKIIVAGLIFKSVSHAIRRHRRISFVGKNVLISGGSRGLGLELARCFAARGANISLLARDETRLNENAAELRRRFGVRLSINRCDVTRPAEVRRAVATIVGELSGIDILVNNAGIIQVGPAEHMTTADYEQALAAHFWAPLYLMQEVIPHMKARGGGRIVNIASIGGKVAVPHLLPYVASKFALVGLSEGMRAELAKDNILVTTVCPGLMRTGSHLNAYFKGQHAKEFSLFSITNSSPLFSTASADAAHKIVEATRYGDSELVITPQARLARLVSAVLPSLTSEILSWGARLLPKATDADGDRLKSGWESRSIMTPSLLTRRSDRAAERNQELR
jgi:NAD(P)-dependent dehydrogenase (short-subunit alcohol dehydrogenase family)